MSPGESRKDKRKAVHRRVRKTVRGTAKRPRLAFFKSASHVYGQLIDDESGRTLVAASTMSKDLKGKVKPNGNKATAAVIGGVIAEKAIAVNITEAVFDRGGFLYHGAAKAFADAAREKGLKF